MTIKAALPRGPQDAREHVLGDGAARRAIAAATEFTGDDRAADGVFGTPVGRIVRGIKQEAEQRAHSRSRCRTNRRMGAVVVHDYVHVQTARRSRINEIEEFPKLHRAMPLMKLRE